MKKLMLTTALAGLVVTGSAMAQTTITGELRLNYKAASSDAVAGVNNTNANSGFGNEQQINFQTKGKLNVGGLDYAAGFSIENDGAQASTLFNENVYMDITNPGSGTTLSIGLDHIQRSDSDRSAAVFFGFSPNDLSSGINKTRFNQNLGPAVSQGMGAAILQKTPIGTLSYNYVPTIATPYAGTPTTGSGSSESFTSADQESGYEYGFTGDFGVKGLSTYYFKAEAEQEKGATTKAESTSWGVAYNMGQISVGYADKKYNLGVSSPSAAGIAATSSTGLSTGKEFKEKHYGVNYAVNNNLSIAAIYAKADVQDTTVTQKVKGIQVGYSLGPVALTAGYAQNTDMDGDAGRDSNIGMVRLIGNF
jgi:hypothetical protein